MQGGGCASQHVVVIYNGSGHPSTLLEVSQSSLVRLIHGESEHVQRLHCSLLDALFDAEGRCRDIGATANANVRPRFEQLEEIIHGVVELRNLANTRHDRLAFHLIVPVLEVALVR